MECGFFFRKFIKMSIQGETTTYGRIFVKALLSVYASYMNMLVIRADTFSLLAHQSISMAESL